MTKMSFGDQLSDSLVHKSFRNHPFFTAVDAAEFTKEQADHALLTDFDAEQERVILAEADNLWKLWTAFFDCLTVEADINQSMSTRGEL
jgi:hypothetical protein